MWDVVVFLESTVSKKEEKGERNIGSLGKNYGNLEKEGECLSNYGSILGLSLILFVAKMKHPGFNTNQVLL